MLIPNECKAKKRGVSFDSYSTTPWSPAYTSNSSRPRKSKYCMVITRRMTLRPVQWTDTYTQYRTWIFRILREVVVTTTT